MNPFQPKVNKDTQDKVSDFLKKHSSNWCTHHVTNPQYEPIKVSVIIRLKRGYEFKYYQNEINKKLQEFLSPWIFRVNKEVKFGGKVTKSMIVQLLENLEYVDYLSGLKIFQSYDGGNNFSSDLDLVMASNPASILVSHTNHEISNN